ncbi:MAG: 3D domain-containing protein [Verrucomicrobiota bacterium]
MILRLPFAPLHATICLVGFLGTPSLPAQTKGTGHWTLYHIAELRERELTGASAAGTVVMLDGSKRPYRITEAEHRKIEMQGTAQAFIPAQQRVAVFSRIKKGLWQELPNGSFGRGNRNNDKSPFRILAADQTIHRFGSRVFRPDLVGYNTSDGMTHDGYFWIGDSGARIKGPLRFDLFVGGETAYAQAMKDGLGKQKVYCEVDRLPDAPDGWNPRTTAGTTRILEALGWQIESGVSSMRAQKINRHSGQSLSQSIKEFQKQHHQIPKAEYGSANGAVTLWFLTHAALATAAKQDYPAGPHHATPGSVLRQVLFDAEG